MMYFIKKQKIISATYPLNYPVNPSESDVSQSYFLFYMIKQFLQRSFILRLLIEMITKLLRSICVPISCILQTSAASAKIHYAVIYQSANFSILL